MATTTATAFGVVFIWWLLPMFVGVARFFIFIIIPVWCFWYFLGETIKNTLF